MAYIATQGKANFLFPKLDDSPPVEEGHILPGRVALRNYSQFKVFL